MLYILCYVQDINAQSVNNNYLSPTHLWAVVEDDMDRSGADTKITYCYSWGQDSIINDMTYRAVTIGYDQPQRFLNMLWYNTYNSLFCYREEGKKIFRFDNDLSKDLLLYDFGVSVGDVITILDGKRVRVTEEFRADELENFCYTFPINGTPPKAWLVCGVDDETYKDIWIDGAGSLYTGLLLRSDFPEDVSLTTIFNASISLSRYTQYDKIQPVRLYYYWNDPNYDSDWETEYNINIEFKDDTLRINGFQNFIPSTHIFRCHLDGNDVVVSAIAVDPGCSMVEGYLQSKYDIKFPGFEAGTYNIKIDRETMGDFRWCDPPEYWKEVTITCNGPATGIDEAIESQTKENKSNIYDLSGRRLNQVPEQGLYIQNGKIIIK